MNGGEDETAGKEINEWTVEEEMSGGKGVDELMWARMGCQAST